MYFSRLGTPLGLCAIVPAALHTRACMAVGWWFTGGFSLQQVTRSAFCEKALGLISVSAYGCLCGLRLSIQQPANELTH